MSERDIEPGKSSRRSFSGEVGAKASRRLRARRRAPRSALTGFAFFGLVGWTVAAPTLIGAGIGMWLDHHHPGGRSWTLALLVAGLVVGCFCAWRWVAKEYRDIKREEENDGDE